MYESDYQLFDVNNSLTIDQADVDCVLAAVANLSYSAAYYSRENLTNVSFPVVNYPVTKDPYADSTESRVYRRFSYDINQEIGAYALYPTTTEMNGGISYTDLILGGEDDREQVNGPENEGIVHLSGGGTGFIVDDHVIATCAHYIYNTTTSTWSQNIVIDLYNTNGTLSNETLTPVEAHIPKEFRNENTDVAYDYALISVEEDLYDYVHFSLAPSYNVSTTTNFDDIPIYVTGCPGEHHIGPDGNGTPNSQLCLYGDEGNIVNSSNPSILCYNVDTSGCQSGAPVYTIIEQQKGNTTSYVYTALAVHRGGWYDANNNTCNGGARITKYQLQFYKNNPFIIY